MVPDKKCSDGAANEWERSGDILEDQLKMYLEDYYYDCTFSVGDGTPKIFKCHKAFLARASAPFAKMLFGDFQESAKDKDDPIMINSNLLPEAFDFAMRFVYGNVKDFQSVELACEVYKFAHEWQMDNLMRAAADFLENVEPKEVILVYEMYKLLNCDTKMEQYYKMLTENTSEVLSSPHWIKASSSTVLELYKKASLKLKSEGELFEALIKWGKHNVEDDAEIRTKIDTPLKLVRFRTMQVKEFADLCLTTDVLTVKEKLQILLSVTTGDADHLPQNFSSSISFRDYSCIMAFSSFPTTDIFVNSDSPKSQLKFSVKSGDAMYYLAGFELTCLSHENNNGLEADLVCFVRSSCCEHTLATAKFNGVIDSKKDGRIEFSHPVILQDNVCYTILVQYFHKNALTAKCFENPDRHESWSWEKNCFNFYLPTDSASHSDITKVRFRFN